jgi:hypothetical protein
VDPPAGEVNRACLCARPACSIITGWLHLVPLCSNGRMAKRALKSTDDKASGDEPKLTEEHKAALAAGRTQGRAVKAYLEALVEHRPRRGRKRTAETVRRRLDTIERELAGDVEPLTRLHLVQERMDLSEELSRFQTSVDTGRLEQEFIEVAADYSTRKGISYTAWREAGVPADVLRRAGISRRAAG